MRQAFQIAWSELKPKSASLLATFLMPAMIGYLFGQSVVQTVHGQMEPRLFNLFYSADLVIMAVLPALGTLYFSKEYMSWSMLSDEPFLKKLKFYRMWAIPLRVVVWSRMINMLICLVGGIIGFVALFVATSWPAVSQHWDLGTYLCYLSVWLGYAVAMNGMNPYMEFALSGRRLLFVTFAAVIAFVVLVSLAQWLLGMPIYVWVMEVVEQAPVRTAGLSLVAGFAGLWLFKSILTSRLTHRDLP